MGDHDKDLGWRPVAIFAAIGTGTLLACNFWPSNASICAPSDVESVAMCVREWVAALSGWIAVAVAVPTITLLVRQIRESNRHQKENLEVLIIEKISHARRASHLAFEVVNSCNYAKLFLETTQATLHGATLALKIGKTDIGDIALFCKGISGQIDYVKKLRNTLRVVKSQATSSLQNNLGELPPHERQNLLNSIHTVQVTMENFLREAREFDRKWSNRIQ